MTFDFILLYNRGLDVVFLLNFLNLQGFDVDPYPKNTLLCGGIRPLMIHEERCEALSNFCKEALIAYNDNHDVHKINPIVLLFLFIFLFYFFEQNLLLTNLICLF